MQHNLNSLPQLFPVLTQKGEKIIIILHNKDKECLSWGKQHANRKKDSTLRNWRYCRL